MRQIVGLVLLAWVGACATRPVRPAGANVNAAGTDVASKLVVVVVIDQLPVRLFDTVKPSFVGGLKRLVGPDAFQSVGHYAHARTLTCPGHATLSTGAPPSVTGIPANAWRSEGKKVNCADASFLKAEAVADVVRAAGGKVASLSIKDRAAVMMGGQAPDAAIWMNLGELTFIGTRPSPTLDAVNARVSLPTWADQPWEALRPDLYAAHFPDAQPFELGPGGIGGTFPHPAARGPGRSTRDIEQAFRAEPSSGDALTDAAIVAVDALALGGDDTRDLLAVSYSDTDYIGHAFTPDSWEAMDGLLRLDQSLDRLFAHLDGSVGAGRWSVVLTSDHGCAGGTGTRIRPRDLETLANKALADAGIAGAVVAEDADIYLPATAKVDDATRARAEAAVIAAVQPLAGVQGVYAWGQPGGVADSVPNAAAIRLSYVAGRSGDVLVVPVDGAMFDSPEHDGTGTGHGTAYDYDTRVPLLAWGAGVRAGVAIDDIDARRVAPTLAALLGVRAPADAALGPVDALLESTTGR